MDEIDAKQQQEINDLQKKDIAHDTQISWMMRIYIGLFVIILALFVGGVILLPIVDQRNENTFWCPHEGCPHHVLKDMPH